MLIVGSGQLFAQNQGGGSGYRSEVSQAGTFVGKFSSMDIAINVLAKIQANSRYTFILKKSVNFSTAEDLYYLVIPKGESVPGDADLYKLKLLCDAL